MAVDPDELDEITATVAAIYREAETALVRIIARHLAGDLDRDMPAPVWAEKKLAAVRSLRRSAQAVIAGLQAAGEGAVRDAAAEAFRAGWRSALEELPAQWFPLSGLAEAARAAAEEVPGFAAIEAVAAAVTRDIGEKSRNILRDVLDAYRSVITATVSRTLSGTQTRREASQAAWARFMSRGIAGFTDRAGRRWQLSSYVEMAVRTVTQRAAVQGQTDRLAAADVDLIMVSNAPQECPLCRPWEGEILTLGADTGDITVPHQLTDEPVTVHVAATLAAAQLAGLFHPNCRHSVSAYLPGVSRPAEKPTADPEGDKARQRQRALERKIRAAKVAEAGALDEAARKAAGRRVRAAQAELREHLDEHPTLKRLRYREQIGAGNIPPRGRDDAAGDIGPDVQPTLDGSDAVRSPRPDRPDDTAPPAQQPPADPDPDQLDLLDQPEPMPDITTWTDEQLEQGIADHADDEELLDAILAELDRRAAEPDVDEGQADAEELEIVDEQDAEKWAQYDELVASGMSEQDAYAEVFDLDPERVRRDEAIAKLRDDGHKGRGFDELARAAYREALQHAHDTAEAATNGYLLNAEGQRRGMDPRDLWRQNEAFARRWASDELKEWWDANGRMTFDVFAATLLSGSAERRFRTGGESWLQ
ncbi:phage minor capsid protein [Actinophytocola sediminis]